MKTFDDFYAAFCKLPAQPKRPRKQRKPRPSRLDPHLRDITLYVRAGWSLRRIAQQLDDTCGLKVCACAIRNFMIRNNLKKGQQP